MFGAPWLETGWLEVRGMSGEVGRLPTEKMQSSIGYLEVGELIMEVAR